MKWKDRKLHDKIMIVTGSVIELLLFAEGTKMTKSAVEYFWGKSNTLPRMLINIAGGVVLSDIVDSNVIVPVYKFINKTIDSLSENEEEFLDDPEDDDLVDDIVIKINDVLTKEDGDGES